MAEKVLAWHFTNGRKLRDGSALETGKVYQLPKGKAPKMCEVGYHASAEIRDALQYAPGFVLSRVELRGDIIKGDDKMVASERKVLWTVGAEKVIKLAACMFAERALEARKKAGKATDDRSWEAIRVARAYLNGKATKAELDTARSTAAAAAAAAAAAYAAAYAAAAAADAAAAAYAAYAAAAYAAAADAADAAAAYAAAADAADAAAAYAAYAAYAAAAAAYSAAYSAARKKERAWQERYLVREITKLRGRHG
jgi:hypothetical protein